MKHFIVYKELEIRIAKSYNVKADFHVLLNGVVFKSGIVSRVEFVKHSFKDEDNLFITLYMGHIEVCTAMTNDDHVIEEDDSINTFRIRKAERFDY